MTEKTVKIRITTEINAKTIKREISVDAGILDSEMIKLKVDVIREAIIGGFEVIDDLIREREAIGWKNFGREKHQVITAVGLVKIKRKVYRDVTGKSSKPMDAIMEL